MMINFLGRSALALTLSLVFAASIHSRNDIEQSPEPEKNQQRYVPYMSPWILPIYVGIMLIMEYTIPVFSLENPYRSTFTLCFSIFLHIGFYYAILSLLLPFFRSRISARTCATLWLLPNYLYLTHNTFMRPSQPLFVLPLSNEILHWAAILWVVGFGVVLAKHIITHLHCRHTILRDSQEIADPAILAIWQQELEFAGMTKKHYRLVRSPAVKTPLTIGFFHRSIRVLLPERHYAPEELSLILRHEIVHIGREDSATKFFLVFCTAMCWFNPLMWLAMRRSADDLELSCDETVLLDADETTRHKYADLLLRTAGDERGFTTCLSASAKALRYRLKNVINPRKRRTGVLSVVLVFYLLIISCGYVSLGFDQVPGQELIFAGQDPASVTIEKVYRPGGSSTTDLDWLNHKYVCTDEEKLTDYVSGLNFCRVSGNYSFSDDSNSVSINYLTPEGKRSLDIEGNAIHLWIYSKRVEHEIYYCTDKLDWALLHSLVVPYPRLEVKLQDDAQVQSHFERKLSAHAHILSTTSGSVTQEYPPADPDSAAQLLHSSSPHYSSAVLDFSHRLYDGTFEVLVENWRRTQSYTVKSSELMEPFTLELPPYFAHYTVRATIMDNEGVIFDTEYRFDLGPMDECSIK